VRCLIFAVLKSDWYQIAEEHGLTADDLARLSGVKFSTVRNIWGGYVKNPELATLAPIARVLNVRIEDLYIEEPEEEHLEEETGSNKLSPNLVVVVQAAIRLGLNFVVTLTAG
jgi:transcriptional regulator with XRE-family HTH domain